MKNILHKQTLTIYWIVLLTSALSLYFDHVLVVVTEPLLVPLLLLYLFLNDDNIGRPAGKLVLLIGLFLAFLGDVLQLVIDNDLFFLSSLVAFMLMNICYSISFLSLDRNAYKRPWLFLLSCLLLSFLAWNFLQFMGDEKLGEFKIPLIIYIATLSLMISTAASLVGSRSFKNIALVWLLPGALVFMIQNIFLAINLFNLGSSAKLYTFSILPYGLAQFLIVKGMHKIYRAKPIP
jgi:uncharacterized membrane protein YhhN